MSILLGLLDKTAALTPGTELLAARAYLTLVYKHKGKDTDLSDDIAPYFLSLSYTDNLSNSADDVTLTLEDRAALWSHEWMPDRGAQLDVTIQTLNWDTLIEGLKTLPLGAFEIDEIELSSLPSVVQIKGLSIIGTAQLRGVEHNRAWENVTLQKVCQDIADANGLQLFYDCDDEIKLERTEQNYQSDLEFLQKLCTDNGLALKVAADKLIVFDEYKYESADPVIIIRHPRMAAVPTQQETAGQEQPQPIIINKLESYRFKIKTRDVYKACHLKYQKGKKDAVIEATFTAPDKKDSDGLTLEISDQADSIPDAERIAKKKLRDKNKEEITGSMTMRGNLNLVAGIVVQVEGFGQFDGKFIIVKATHDLSDGYTTSIDIRRCLNGY